ncbi:MAG TPA: hypothetical protein VGK44_08210 [Casimicrobiaceae bacterium]|jgi:hypothetical protein
MNQSLIALAVAGATFAMAACNAPDRDRTTSIPRMVAAAATVQGVPHGLSAPAAPRDLTPPPANANKAAPGTDPEAAFADKTNYKDPSPQPSKDGAPDAQHRAVMAQEAAAKAPDTASADEAKKAVMSEKDAGSASSSGSKSAGAGSSRSKDQSTHTADDNPRHGALTKDEEVNKGPQEGQTNNFSSTDLEKDSGRPSDGSASKETK